MFHVFDEVTYPLGFQFLQLIFVALAIISIGYYNALLTQ